MCASVCSVPRVAANILHVLYLCVYICACMYVYSYICIYIYIYMYICIYIHIGSAVFMTHLHVTWIVQYDKAHSHVYSCTGSKGKHGVLVRNSWVWVMSRIRMCHVTYINEWCHVWMCHVTYQCGMSHTWMNSYTRLKSKHGALVRNSCLPACSHCSSTTANRLPLPPVFYHNRAFWMNLGLFCQRQGSFECW